MKKPEELVSEAINSYAELRHKNAVLSDIYQILDAFQKKPFRDWTLDQLSRAAGELSVYLVNLGDYLADAQLEANSAYIYRKLKYASDFKKLRKELETVRDAEFGASIEETAEYELQLMTQHRADLLKLLYENCNRLISVTEPVKALRERAS